MKIGIEESFHYLQQKQLGFARFYGRIFSEALNFGFDGAYDTSGTLENDAKRVIHDFNNKKPFKK